MTRAPRAASSVGRSRLPKVQADLGGTRSGASLAYTAAMIGFGFGGVVTGRLTAAQASSPRGALSLLLDCLGAGISTALWPFVAAYFFIGLGASAPNQMVFLNGLAWNAVDVVIVLRLLLRARRGMRRSCDRSADRGAAPAWEVKARSG